MTSIAKKSVLSRRASEVEESVTLAMTAKANAMRDQGIDVISFSAGEPDFDTPEHIKKAAADAMARGQTKYTPASGLLPLRKAVAAKFQRDNGLAYDPSQIVVSCGAKHSLYNVMQAVLEEGDEAIIPAPYWVSYPAMVKCAGATPVIVTTDEKNGLKMTAEQLRKAITERTKCLILCSPSNPTGMVYTAAELKAVADVCVEKDLLVISDEIYEKLVFGVPFASIATARPEMKERTVVVNGASKAYAMTGWRIGYAAGPKEIMTAAGRMQSQSTSNATSIAQYATIAALEGDQACVETMRVEYAKRRDYIVGRLRKIPGVACGEPQGAFYVFPRVSALYGKKFQGKAITGSVAMSETLLEKAHIATVPGSGFGADEYIRLSYATSMEKISGGLDRLEKFVKELS
ncbi:MAG TPA: pyridoxal phosphate-dependent aminotransferase [Planctomycetota bacterium]|nr:pyridoxal phosphate-dependent aminotransferase [Planctomycetota bacterium]